MSGEATRVEAVLRADPRVKMACVTRSTSADHHDAFLALVELAEPGASHDLDGDRRITDSWQALFDEVYTDSSSEQVSRFNTAGWISSITGDPFSEQEMCEWLKGTISRICEFALGDVLEVGCGTGMLVSRLGCLSKSYNAMDVSSEALSFVREHLPEWDLKNVTLTHADISSFDKAQGQTFDTIIFNSVIQYFPSERYLFTALESCLTWLRPNGIIFIGDVRHIGLQAELSLMAALHNAPPAATAEAICQSAMKSILEEAELLVHPEWFYALQDQCRGISAVRIELRRGRDHNELSKYRYDVLLQKSGAENLHRPIASVSRFSPGIYCEDDLAKLAAACNQQIVRLAGIPNARLQTALEISNLLPIASPSEPFDRIPYKGTKESSPAAAIDPEYFWQLGSKVGRRARVTWSASRDPSTFDVLFYGSLPEVVSTRPVLNPEVPKSLISNPIEAEWRKLVVRQLRSRVRETLGNLPLSVLFVNQGEVRDRLEQLLQKRFVA